MFETRNDKKRLIRLLFKKLRLLAIQSLLNCSRASCFYIMPNQKKPPHYAVFAASKIRMTCLIKVQM